MLKLVKNMMYFMVLGFLIKFKRERSCEYLDLFERLDVVLCEFKTKIMLNYANFFWQKFFVRLSL